VYEICDGGAPMASGTSASAKDCCAANLLPPPDEPAPDWPPNLPSFDRRSPVGRGPSWLRVHPAITFGSPAAVTGESSPLRVAPRAAAPPISLDTARREHPACARSAPSRPSCRWSPIVPAVIVESSHPPTSGADGGRGGARRYRHTDRVLRCVCLCMQLLQVPFMIIIVIIGRSRFRA
jgi:hypothetical protein